MAKGMHISTKRIQIDKANSTIVVAVGVAAFAVAFSLIAGKSLIARQSYQNKVIKAQEQARDQLISNIDAVDDLKTKYSEFVGRQENIIKGNSAGNSERDGDNARIILDALPSKYDFPALASSLEKILVDRSYKIQTISGVDDEAAQNGGGQEAASDPAVADASQEQQAPVAAVEMLFELGAEGNYSGIMDLLGVLRNSIRPLHVQKLTFSVGDGDSVQVNISGKSYYQPERTLNITEEVVQ